MPFSTLYYFEIVTWNRNKEFRLDEITSNLCIIWSDILQLVCIIQPDIPQVVCIIQPDIPQVVCIIQPDIPQVVCIIQPDIRKWCVLSSRIYRKWCVLSSQISASDVDYGILWHRRLNGYLILSCVQCWYFIVNLIQIYLSRNLLYLNRVCKFSLKSWY